MTKPSNHPTTHTPPTPGTEWRYSVGFDVLGVVIQRVSQMSLEEFMRVGGS